MSSIVPGFEYDVFVSYRHNDNLDGWVTDFVHHLENELKGTFKEPISLYFDTNPHDGLLETHSVDKSLERKLNCLVFLPIVSQTYCDTKCFAWRHEFLPFTQRTKEDPFGIDIRLSNGNVASRVLEVQIHDLESEDKAALESELGEFLRSIEFIYKAPGVNRPLNSDDVRSENNNHTVYRDQINKVANAIKERILSLKHLNESSLDDIKGPPGEGNIESVDNTGKQTDEIHRVDRRAGKAENRQPASIRRLIAVGLVCLVALAIILYKWTPKVIPSIDSKDKSIAVLAFSDMSSLHDQEYLSDGIADEINNRLCKFSDLTVAGMTSAFSFKGKQEDIKSIGKKLNVAHILEGTVRKDGNNILITIRLTKADNGFTLLSESYEGELKNIFSLQKNIAIDIAEKIKSKLSPHEEQRLSRKAVNPLAYETYLKGRACFINGPFSRSTKLLQARQYFMESTTLDTAFAEAYAFLGITYFNLYDWAIPKTEKRKRELALDSAQMFATRALLLDPSNSAAHLAMGSVYFHQWRWAEAENEKRKAVELNPGGAFEKMVLASFLSQFNQNEEALLLDSQAIKLDPLNPSNGGQHFMVLYRSRKFDDCIRLAKEIILQKPDSVNMVIMYGNLGYAYCGKGDYNNALKAWATVQAESGRAALVPIFQKEDFRSAMLYFINYSNKNHLTFDHITMAVVYGLLQDRNNTLKYMNRAYEDHIILTHLRWQHAFDFVRNDPGFLEVYEKYGFKAYDDYKVANKKEKI